MYRRYIKVIGKCHETKSFEDCFDFCSEFNMNKMTYLFDGEAYPFIYGETQPLEEIKKSVTDEEEILSPLDKLDVELNRFIQDLKFNEK